MFRLVASGFCFGAIGIFVKNIGPDISSVLLSSLRLLVTPLLILAYLFISGRIEEIYVTARKEKVISLLGGVLGFGPTFGFYVSSLKMIPVSEAVFLHFLAYPLSTIIYKNLKEKGGVKASEWIAFFLGLIGISLIYGLSPAFSGGNLLGYTYAFLSGIFYAVTTVCLKELGRNRTLMGTVFWPMLLGGGVLVPLSLLKGPVINLNSRTLLSLSGLILVSTFLGFLMMAWGMRAVQAHVGSITLILSEPLAAVLLAWMVLGETPSLSVLFGGLFVVGSGTALRAGRLDGK